MLYTPECFVQYPEPLSGAAAAAPAAKGKDGKDGVKSKDADKKETPAADEGGASAPTDATGAKPEPSEKDKDKDKDSSSFSPTSAAAKPAADGGGPVKAKAPPASGDGLAGGGAAVTKPKPAYYGVDEARKRVALKCTSCGKQGALIGCHVQSCSISTHYACARREGWRFGDPDADGKLFLCGIHRNQGQVRFERKTPAKKGPRKSGELRPVPAVFFALCFSRCARGILHSLRAS